MGETAEERARRFALRHGEPRWYWVEGTSYENTWVRCGYRGDGLAEMPDPDVSLVKKYSKGTFKF